MAAVEEEEETLDSTRTTSEEEEAVGVVSLETGEVSESRQGTLDPAGALEEGGEEEGTLVPETRGGGSRCLANMVQQS